MPGRRGCIGPFPAGEGCRHAPLAAWRTAGVQAERAGEKDRQWLAAELLPMLESENEHILRQREAGEYDRLLDLVRAA
jgi:hypothetical protein